MPIIIRINGNSAGDGFLITPDSGSRFAVPLNLSTNDGSTVNATLDATIINSLRTKEKYVLESDNLF